MKINKKYSAIILSAGKSSRMGVPKFSLKFDGESTFLENLVREYALFGCEEIIVVLNNEGKSVLNKLNIKLPDFVKLVINQHPEWERFYSLKLGVRVLSHINPTFVSNIDNPFICQKVLSLLSNSTNNADYINPVYNERGGHPFLISDKIVRDLISEERDQIHLKEFLARYSKKSILVDDDKILANINTEEEYKIMFTTKIKK